MLQFQLSVLRHSRCLHVRRIRDAALSLCAVRTLVLRPGDTLRRLPPPEPPTGEGVSGE